MRSLLFATFPGEEPGAAVIDAEVSGLDLRDERSPFVVDVALIRDITG
jgi:hypothetical protein